MPRWGKGLDTISISIFWNHGGEITCFVKPLHLLMYNVTCDYMKAGKPKRPKICRVKCHLKARAGFHCCDQFCLHLYTAQWNCCAPSIQISKHTVLVKSAEALEQSRTKYKSPATVGMCNLFSICEIKLTIHVLQASWMKGKQ